MRLFAVASAFLLSFIMAADLYAAVGCDLNDPDRDVKRLFPSSTGFKTVYVSIDRKGGDRLLGEIEERLGDRFKGLFETADVPYTIYEIYRGKEIIGYIHGVNQKGQYGGIQVILGLDTSGVITAFYYQKLTSRQAKKLKEPAFGRQFIGLSLKNFYGYDVSSGKSVQGSLVDRIKNPDTEADVDFRASLRGVKKNLILMDEFVFGNRHIQFKK